MATNWDVGRSNTGCSISHDVFQVLKETYCSVDHKRTDKVLYNEISMVLSKPPTVSVLRVNNLKFSTAKAENILQSHLNSESCLEFSITEHPKLDDILVISTDSSVKNDTNQTAIVPHLKEVIVDEFCGVAVLRGADVFACGILGAPPGMVKGDCVSIHADLEGKCRKGSKVEFKGLKYFVGNGIAVLSRNDIFQERQPRGVAIEVTSQPFRHPSFHELDREAFFPQNLPSTLVGHILKPKSGDIILDMCAAPGGKASHAATLMMNKGKVYAIDKSKSRVKKMQEICTQQGLSCVKCLVFDSTQLCDSNGGFPSHDEYPPFRPCSFDKIILDPPCSGIGQRPQLQCKLKANELRSYPLYQRKLFSQAVQLLKPNGTLIYSTCTITIEENENQVAWALKTFKELKLVSQDFHFGGEGISRHQLLEDYCSLVQRFDPCLLSITETIEDRPSIDQDTIGFFIALFIKS